jgi:hypothetical protein
MFTFKVDSEGQRYCEEIVDDMMSLFSISRQEAVGRVNRHWVGQAIIGLDIIYHEDTEYWAKTIYYEENTAWWKPGVALKARPFP